MLNFLFGRQSACQELKTLVQQLTLANEKMMARAKGAQQVGDTLYALVQSEAPSYAVSFERVKEIYTRLSFNYETASKDQSRAIEDLSDIIVRYPVLQKISMDRDAVKKTYDAVNKKYQEAKVALKNQVSQETLAAYRNCRMERSVAAAALLERNDGFLNYRSRFVRFVQNRSESAWSRYGASIEKTARVEADLMTELAEICRTLRESTEGPLGILTSLEQKSSELRMKAEEKVDLGGVRELVPPVGGDLSDDEDGSDGIEVPPALAKAEDIDGVGAK
jgi:hypothetical protein